MSHPSVVDRLARLAPDQRAAATAPPGPVLCVAPAGSGKTTTLVARVAWLVDGGADPAGICVVAFNRRAAEELLARLDAALEPLGAAGSVRVRTFHALGREILAEAGVDVDALVDRDAVLRALFPGSQPTVRGRLDLAFSRLKLDLGVRAADIAADPEPGPVARAFVAYEGHLEEEGALDFDDLVVRALAILESHPAARAAWRGRAHHLLVDEAQDLDRTQLRMALLLAEPANRVFLVGDDDQTIYGWRLADVRRVLGLAAELPGLRRVDLVTNYRCPAPVVARAVRLVERNAERFAKRIVARPGAEGRLVLAPDPAEDEVRVERALRTLPPGSVSAAVLARTNRELLAAVVAAVAVGMPFAAPDLQLATDDARVDELLARARALDIAEPGRHHLRVLGAVRDHVAALPAPDEETPPACDVATALLGWAARAGSLEELATMIARWRDLVVALRRTSDAPLVLATAHGTKGLEWDHVIVLADGFPGRRSVADAVEPERALEEERRLAYVAWTRARSSLTLLHDPATPSPFLREAFDPEELAPMLGGPVDSAADAA